MAKRLIELIGADELSKISMDYPFRKERDAKIQELYRRGVPQIVLTEVSGLSDSSISRICLFGANK